MQAEIQANHCGVCPVAPPTLSSSYIFIMIEVERRRLKTARWVLQWLRWQCKPSTGVRSLVNPQLEESLILQKRGLTLVKSPNTYGSNPGCGSKTGDLHTSHTTWQQLCMQAGVCARLIPPHDCCILLWQAAVLSGEGHGYPAVIVEAGLGDDWCHLVPRARNERWNWERCPANLGWRCAD